MRVKEGARSSEKEHNGGSNGSTEPAEKATGTNRKLHARDHAFSSAKRLSIFNNQSMDGLRLYQIFQRATRTTLPQTRVSALAWNF